MLHFKDQLLAVVYIVAQYLTTSNSVIMVELCLIKTKHGNYYQLLVLDKTWHRLPDRVTDKMTNDGRQSIQ